MVDGSPRPGGEIPFSPHMFSPADTAVVTAVHGTQWEIPATPGGMPVAPEQVPEELRGLVVAGAVHWHSTWVVRHVSGQVDMQDRPARLVQAPVTGRSIYETVGDLRQRGYPDTTVATVMHHSREVGSNARRMVARTLHSAPQATPEQITQLLYAAAAENMSGLEYDGRDWHRVLRQLAADASHGSTEGAAARRTQAMLHHFSDSYLAPPAALPSRELTQVLGDFRKRYERWVATAGIPPGDATRQVMERLLEGDVSFRQYLAQHPEQEDALREQAADHLFGMFTLVAAGLLPRKGRAPGAPNSRSTGEAPALRNRPIKRTAAAAGTAAVTKAVTPAAADAAGTAATDTGEYKAFIEPDAVIIVARPPRKATKAAAPKKAAPKKVAKAAKAAAPKDAADAAARAGEGIDTDSLVEDGDRDAATAAGAAAVAEVFDFRTAEDIAADVEATREAKGFDAWTITSETDEGYADAQTTGIMTTDNVRVYLREIGRTPLLNADQEVELSKAIEAGLFAKERADALHEECAGRLSRLSSADRQLYKDYRTLQHAGERATNLFLEANLRLVVSIAKRYKGRGMSFLDLIQEGNLGLIRGVQKFDYTKGYKFSTYATWWIRQALTRALADQARTIRIPVHMVEDVNRMARIRREMVPLLQRDPTPEEIAEEMGLTLDKVMKIIDAAKDTVSLDKAVGEDGETLLGDFVADKAQTNAAHSSAAASEQTAEIEGVLSTLDDRAAGIIRYRMGLVDGRIWTLDEVAQVYGVTRERIRQLEVKALAKLKDGRSEHMRDYYEIDDE